MSTAKEKPEQTTDWEKWLLRTLMGFFMIASTYYLNNINKNMELVRTLQINQIQDENRISNIETKANSFDTRISKLEDFREQVLQTPRAKQELKSISDISAYDPKKHKNLPFNTFLSINTLDACINFEYQYQLETLFEG